LIKKLLFFVIFVAAIVALVHRFKGPPPQAEKAVVADVYICPSHRDLEYNRPGKCNVCGEELVLKEKKD